MEKSMYSLMLMDSIIKEIDRLAYERGTNRSNYINQVLAEYLKMETPETRVKEIFSLMTTHLNGLDGFKIHGLPANFVMAIKSPLEYKYRPTIKYSVEIFRTSGDTVGELRVVFRTRHGELLSRLSAFYDLWIGMEKYYIHKRFKNASIHYNVEDGRFRRDIMFPASRENVTDIVLSKAIGDYIKMFDGILKHYISDPQANTGSVERRYVDCLNGGMIII